MAGERMREEGEPVAVDKGYLHLTPRGWIREDQRPFPDDRIETWRLDMERPAADAKERDRLTRIWVSMNWSLAAAKQLRAQFGEAVAPTVERNIEIQCKV